MSRAADQLDGVTWLGGQTIDNIYDLMGCARAVLFPSEWYETLGRVVIEAYSRSTPVIASNLGAISELVTPEETGLLFDPGCPDFLAHAAQRMWDEPDHARQMGRNGHALFEQKYTAEQYLNAIDEIYTQVTNGARMSL